MSKTKLCPICKKPFEADTIAHAPFCSLRCKDRDLAQWFGDGYAVPGRAASPEEIASEVIRGDND
jgi:endogenous inhibitor of DNA gyrase (YacG/DUF329 family)